MPMYVRGLGQTWHFCPNCPEWPKRVLERITTSQGATPPAGELCPGCQALRERGECQ